MCVFVCVCASGEVSPRKREAVKKKTAEYLMRAELIANTYLKDSMGQSSTQNRVSGNEIVLYFRFNKK